MNQADRFGALKLHLQGTEASAGLRRQPAAEARATGDVGQAADLHELAALAEREADALRDPIGLLQDA